MKKAPSVADESRLDAGRGRDSASSQLGLAKAIVRHMEMKK